MSDPETSVPATAVSRATIAKNMVVNIVHALGDIAKGLVTSLGSLVDGLKGSGATIEEISCKIATTNASYAMQLSEFSKELRLLDDYYSNVYIKTKAMVEFGMNEDVIPNIKDLIIVKKDYLKAVKEIKCFLEILAGRIKVILNELEDHEEKIAISEELQEQIHKLNKKFERSKEHLENLAAEHKNAECYRIGKNILLLIGMTTGGMWLCGDRPVNETLEVATSYIASNPEVLSFITEKGMKGLDAMGITSSDVENLKATIEKHARKMSKQFHEFFHKITEFQIQISTIVNNTEELKKYTEGLQHQLEDDSQAVGRTTTEWVDVAMKLQEMYELFEKLDEKVVQKKISWQHDVETPV